MPYAEGEPRDQELVERANRGSEEAMTLLYERHREWVYGQALRVCGSEEDAADVLQETFLYLFRKFPGFTLTCRLTTFLYPVVRHLALDACARRKRLKPLDDSFETAVAPPERDEAVERERLAEELAGLSELHREAVLLRFADGLSLEEMAGRLGVPLGTVKSRLHNALQILRTKLSPPGGES